MLLLFESYPFVKLNWILTTCPLSDDSSSSGAADLLALSFTGLYGDFLAEEFDFDFDLLVLALLLPRWKVKGVTAEYCGIRLLSTLLLFWLKLFTLFSAISLFIFGFRPRVFIEISGSVPLRTNVVSYCSADSGERPGGANGIPFCFNTPRRETASWMRPIYLDLTLLLDSTDS